MKSLLRAASAALVVFAPLAIAQGSKKPAATPAPAGGMAVTTSTNTKKPPEGSKPAEIQDIRVLTEKTEDPYELERLGVAAATANELGRAREFLDRSWKVGDLPSAAFNLACIDVREGKHDAAFAHLEKAVAAGFDEDENLLKDADLAPIRDKAKFSSILAGAKRNRATGDAAVVTDGTFVGPGRTPTAILVVLHDVASDPFTAAGPFTAEAKARGFFLAVPRGPARAGHKRFGWGSPERATAAVETAVDAAKKKAGNPALPVLLVGIGRGGTIALIEGSRKAGAFAGIASLGGPFDAGMVSRMPGTSGAGLAGTRLFLGIPRDAPPNLIAAFRNGRDALGRAGAHPSYVEWPGAGTAFPQNVPQAVKEALDTLTGVTRS